MIKEIIFNAFSEDEQLKQDIQSIKSWDINIKIIDRDLWEAVREYAIEKLVVELSMEYDDLEAFLDTKFFMVLKSYSKC